MAKKAVHYLRPLTIATVDWRTQYRSGCGKRLTKTEKYRAGAYLGRRRTWVAERRPTPNGVTCAACLRWLALSPDEREAHDLGESTRAKAAHGKLAEKRKVDQAAAAAERDAHVQTMRTTALVAMDAVLAGRTDGNDPDVMTMLAEALATAMVAYRAVNPRTRGERRWVFETSATAPASNNIRIIACRFCRRCMGSGEIGYDYSTSCFDANGVIVHWPNTDENRPRIAVSVARHTTLCALAYLAGVANPEPMHGVMCDPTPEK